MGHIDVTAFRKHGFCFGFMSKCHLVIWCIIILLFPSKHVLVSRINDIIQSQFKT